MTTQTETQRMAEDMDELATDVVIRLEGHDTLLNSVAKEMRRLEAANAELMAALVDVSYTLEKARIWGGMDWTYNQLHPVHYLPARDKARAAIAQHGGQS